MSLVKGLLKNSIGGTIGIDVEVINVHPKYLNLRFYGYEYLKKNYSSEIAYKTIVGFLEV